MNKRYAPDRDYTSGNGAGLSPCGLTIANLHDTAQRQIMRDFGLSKARARLILQLQGYGGGDA